jgi:hypothetical protein
VEREAVDDVRHNCRSALALRPPIGDAGGVSDDAYWRRRAEEEFAEAARNAVSVASTLVGVKEDDALRRIEDAGCSVRVIERDGEVFPHTADRRPSRINLRVAQGTITAADVG